MSLAAVACTVLAFGASPPDSHRDGVLRQALHELHEERFEAALTSAATLRQRWPDDPAGFLAEANVHQTMMRDYRVRAFEKPFLAALDQALAVSERAVRDRPTADSFFARGTARAYRAVHRFTQGDWIPAILDAVRGVGDARRAHSLDATFVDPLLATAVHDYWKGEKLGLARVLFGGGGQTVVSRLERVRAEARFLQIEAVYALQTIHYREGDYARAREANDWLFARFPRNPVGLYHRALIQERLGRVQDALVTWDALRARLAGAPHRSEGFLAECELHRAGLLVRAGSAAAAAQARAAARAHAARRDHERELEGPLVSFSDVRERIERLDLRSPARAPAAPTK